MADAIAITLSGTGTSVGVPMPGCRCAVCRSDDPRDRRGRASVILRHPDGPVAVIDAGPDFREQMLRHDVRRLDALLLTHDHADHIGGLDDIRAYNFLSDRALPIHASQETWTGVRARFAYIWDAPQLGGGLPRIDAREERGAAFVAAGMRFIPLPVRHGLVGAWGFRVGDFVYASDLSEIPSATLEHMRGARELVIGAVQYQPHPTHLHVDKALDYIRRLAPGRAWLTHVNHGIGHADLESRLPPNVGIAHDGLTLEARGGLEGC